MSANTTDVKNEKAKSSLQGWVLGFVVLITIMLIVMPTLPVFMSNLTYSFSGVKPKIYWYLSRSGGFVTLTVLWFAMALGLGITNKMARQWPGAPTAFAVHQYTSLLGLIFAAYHGLVLMGDHYTDFSLPRLIVPFSIAYKTFWMGLGQICFYAWLLVAISFYVRPIIGQKTWRVIHYINFLTYVMGFMHAVMTGTDTVATWARGYYWFTGMSLLGLLMHRVYEAKFEGKFSLAGIKFYRPTSRPEFIPSIFKVTTVPSAIRRAHGYEEETATPTPATTPATAMLASIVQGTVDEKFPEPAMVAQQQVEQSAAGAETPAVKQRVKMPKQKVKSSSPIERIHTDQFRVRIFREPTTRPIPELQSGFESIEDELHTLFTRVKQSFGKIPVEPTIPRSCVRLSSSSD